MIKYFNRCFCYTHIDLIFHILIRHGVVHLVYCAVLVELDSGLFPLSELERGSRQRWHDRLFFPKIQTAPAAVVLFHSASSKGVARSGASNGFSAPRNKLSLLHSFFWNSLAS